MATLHRDEIAISYSYNALSQRNSALTAFSNLCLTLRISLRSLCLSMSDQPSIPSLFKDLDALFESSDFTSINYQCTDLELRLEQVDQLYLKRTEFPTDATHDSVVIRIIKRLRQLGKKVGAGNSGDTNIACDILHRALVYAAKLKNPTPNTHMGITDDIMLLRNG